MSTAGLPGDRLAHRTHPVAVEAGAAMAAGAASEAPQPSNAASTVTRAIPRSLTDSFSPRIKTRIRPVAGRPFGKIRSPRRPMPAHTVPVTVALGTSRAHRASPVQPERAVESDVLWSGR